MCVLERLVRAALAAKTTKDRCEPTIDRPPLAPEIVAALGEEIYHRATCAYCAWVGPDRPLREPMDQDERDHLATCEKNPARTVEAELADAREGLGRWKSRADQLTLDLQEARATALRVAPTVFR